MTTSHTLPWTLLWLFACQGTPQATAEPSAPDGGADEIARWDGGALLRHEVESRIADELRQMDIEYRMARYERVRDVLDAAVEEALIERELARRDLTDRADLYAAEIDSKLTEPTEQELRQEFNRFVENMPHATFESARGYLHDELINLRKQARHAEFLQELKQAAHLDIQLPFPEVPRVDVPVHDHDPVLGSADAAVTIVQFSGFQCYYCRRVNPTLQRLIAEQPGKVRLVHKDFPIAGHARAQAASTAAHCAGDRFWEMSDILLENQGRLEQDHLRAYAEGLGLDLPAWDACMEDESWARRLDEDVHLGRALGVSSTPTFFVNGVMITGAMSYDRFSDLIQQELARTKR